MERDFKTKVSRSNVRLMVDKEKKGWGFYASILFKMPMVEKDDIPTMATDGKSIFFNEEWSNTLTEEELDFVRCHEGMHRVLRHHLRVQDRDSNLWNIATDYAINSILKKSGMKMPKDGLYDAKYDGMSAESIYKSIEQNADTREVPKPCNWGQVNPNESMTEEQIKAEENMIRAEVTMAVQGAKDIGNLPSDIKSIIQEIERSQVDWSSVIRRVVGGDQPEDYTYRRPNRRALHCFDMYNPSTMKMSCGDVAVWVDTSGSVSTKEKQHALGELQAIAEDMQPNSITIFYGDADVQNIERYERGDVIDQLNSKGGGGTDPMPIFKYIEENDVNVDSMVCITDMEFNKFPSHVDYPLLWVSTNLRAKKPPIGEITFINV